MSNFMKFSVGAEVFQSDRRTDRQTEGRTDRHDKPNSRFSQFCERPCKRKNVANLKKKSYVCVD